MSQATFNEMLRRQYDPVGPRDESFGLGIVVEETPYGKKYSHGGRNMGFTCQFAIYDDSKVGYVFFTNSEQADLINESIEAYLIKGKTKD
jgi:hypothetical protein